MNPARVVIADDEAPARARIRELLVDRPDATVVGESSTGPETDTAIDALRPDLVFLDVQMPGSSGLEVARRLPAAERPLFVFATAYDSYALDAFDLEAASYLLKPFTDERFDQALHRALALLRATGDRNLAGRLQRLEQLVGTSPAPIYPDRITIKDRGRLLVVPTAAIERVDAAGDYVRIVTRDRSHLVRATMAIAASWLDPARYLRVHRSHCVRVDLIAAVEPYFHGEAVVTLTDGQKLRVGATYWPALRSRLGGV